MDRHPYQMLCVPWAQRHHCEGEKALLGNKHLSCANWSVKCTNCRGGGDVSAGVTALGLGAMSSPGISYRPFTPSPPSLAICWGAQWQLLFTGCLPHFLIFILTGHHKATGSVSPPLPMSLLRGGSGKISSEHLDHLFRVWAANQIAHICVPGSFPHASSLSAWMLTMEGTSSLAQRASSLANTNATWRSFCEQCESAKCMINRACQGGFIAEKCSSWSQALLWLWLFSIMGVDSALLAAI